MPEPPVGFARWDHPGDVMYALRARFAPFVAWATRVSPREPVCECGVERQRIARGILELGEDLEAAERRIGELS